MWFEYFATRHCPIPKQISHLAALHLYCLSNHRVPCLASKQKQYASTIINSIRFELPTTIITQTLKSSYTHPIVSVKPIHCTCCCLSSQSAIRNPRQSHVKSLNRFPFRIAASSSSPHHHRSSQVNNPQFVGCCVSRAIIENTHFRICHYQCCQYSRLFWSNA